MSSLVVAFCLTFLVIGFVDSSENSDVCKCELCHKYLEELTPYYCSTEKKFEIIQSKVNWFQALEDCEIKGYKLASITGQNDTENLLKYMKEKDIEDGSFWMSGTDLQKEGEYVWWTSPTTPFDQYTNWYSGSAPTNNNDNNKDCVQVGADGTWNDAWCYESLSYVCEYYWSL